MRSEEYRTAEAEEQKMVWLVALCQPNLKKRTETLLNPTNNDWLTFALLFMRVI